MNSQRVIQILQLIIISAVIAIISCSSPLMDVIKEEVEVIKTPPTITSVYPSANTTSISIEDDIQIVFTKNIQASSVTSGTFIIEDEYGDSSTGSYVISSDTVTFSPNKLYYNTEYTVNATNGILDIDGNTFNNGYIWTFTTQAAPSSVKPLFDSFDINNGRSATSEADIEIQFTGSDYLESTSGLEVHYRISSDTDWSEWVTMEDGLKVIPYTLPVSGTDDETFEFHAEIRDTNKVVSSQKDSQIIYKTSSPEIDNINSYPVPGSNDSPGNMAYIKIQFNSEMEPSSITDNSVVVSKGTTQITTYEFEFTEDMSGVEFTVFNDGAPDYKFEANTDYTVFIDSSVTDVAGIPFGSDYTYSFRTGGINDETAPEGIIVLDLDNPDINALSGTNFDLMIKAEDDYNDVRAVKIWGDNNGSGFPTFESDATWYLYSEGAGPTSGGINYMQLSDIPGTVPYDFSGGWDILNIDKDYFIYYKFIDYANNESLTAGRLRISRDGTPPVLNGIQIADGSGYSNNDSGTVNIIIDALDIHSGLEGLWVQATPTNSGETVPATSDGSWGNWASLIASYALPSNGEGEYYVWAAVKDFVGNVYPLEGNTAVSDSIIIDYTNPEVDFSGIEVLEVNSLAYQDVSISDPTPSDGGGNDVESGIATYYWEQISGPGTLLFYSDAGGTTQDSTVDHPYIKGSVEDGTEDGVYDIKVTATDKAGNSYSSTTNFIWDTTDPEEIGTLNAYHDDDSSLTTSSNGAMVYTSSAQPYITWSDSSGADFYVAIPWYEEYDPKLDPGVQHGVGGWYPHWDDDEVDWDNPGTYENKNYLRQETAYVSAPPPDNPGQNDGPVYLYVSAWDISGNRSNRIDDQMVRFHIDTLPPIINILQDLPPSNSTLNIDFRNSDNGGDGRVYDQKTPDDPDDPESGVTQSGSEIATYLWEQDSGTGTLDFLNPTTLTPSVSAAADGSEDDEYTLKLTVTDNAGNVGEGYISLVWDTTAPSNPSVNGISHTPSRNPTWSWNSNGGGNSYFRYRLERIAREWESNGGGYSGSVQQEFDWTSESISMSYNGITLDDKYEYTLYVQERDDAGNWSNSDSQSIWIDTNYTSEPAITRDGDYLRNASATSVTWDWSTGLGNPATERYRWRINGGNWTPLSIGDKDHTEVFNTNGSEDGIHSFEVEEYNTSFIYPDADGWVGKIGSSTVEIDATAPSTPVNYAFNSGYNIESNGYHLTNDTTPYLRWSTGGGGNGNYQWSFDESNWTATASIYTIPSISEGVYIFYVQERDDAGNWSTSETYNLEVDTTAPTLSSILLSNRSTNAANTTTYAVSPNVDVDVTGSGSNTTTYSAGDVRRMVFWNDGGTEYTVYVSGSPSTFYNWYFGTNGGDDSDGGKNVYCKLIDYAGNESVVRSDGITLDATPPVVSSFSINGGSATSTTKSVTLNSTLTADAYAMRISNDGGSTWSAWNGDSTAKAWTLETSNGSYSGYGAKKVMVQFTDLAGYYCRNTTTQLAGHDRDVSDSIFYGTPTIKYANKGQYSSGAIYVNYEDFEDTGDSTNRFYIYYSTSPGGTKYEKGNTENNSQYYSSTWAKGTLYYLTIRVYNPDIGWSNYSSEDIGFSSNITVLYDSADSTDTSTANYIKTVLQKDLPALYPTSIAGTHPTWTVTLVPEDLVSSVYDGSGYNLIYGDPIIITPSAGDLYQNANKSRNIVASNHGVVAMGYYGGLKFLETVSNNWTAWGYPASTSTFTLQRPNEISYGNSYTYVAGMSFMYTWRWSNNVWTYPLNSTSIPTSSYEDQTQIGYASAPMNERGLYRSGRNNPTNGYLLGRSLNYTDRFPVVQQGRFLYYGYDGLWTRPYTGWAYWVNLIARMDNY